MLKALCGFSHFQQWHPPLTPPSPTRGGLSDEDGLWMTLNLDERDYPDPNRTRTAIFSSARFKRTFQATVSDRCRIGSSVDAVDVDRIDRYSWGADQLGSATVPTY